MKHLKKIKVFDEKLVGKMKLFLNVYRVYMIWPEE